MPSVLSNAGESTEKSEVYDRVRRSYEEYVHVTFEELGLASRVQTRELLEWVSGIDPYDEETVREAQYYFESDYKARMASALKLHAAFISELGKARHDGVISRQSYNEWIEWMRDPERPYKEKEQAVVGRGPEGLAEYLAERRIIARERNDLLSNGQLDEVNNAKLKKEIEFLRDDREWFETLSVSQRRNLIDRIKAGLLSEKGGRVYEELFRQAEQVLITATKEPQPALHRDKVGTWLKRIFGSGADTGEIRAFVTGNGLHKGNHSLPALVASWRKIAVEFWQMRSDNAFEGVKTDFINTKAFLWKHYDERVAYVRKMRVQRDRAKVLRSQAISRLGVPDRVAWVNEHLFNGTHSLADLESIINGDLAQHLAPLQDYMEEKQGKEAEHDESDASKEPESSQIRRIIAGMPVGLQGMMTMLCILGSGAVHACGWGIYNRYWCNKNGYLDEEREQEAIRVGKIQALMKARKAQRRGVVNETIHGETGEKEYIELSRTSATNVCLDITDVGAKSAFVETVRRTKNDGRAWYWTNVIFHRDGDLMSLSDQKIIQDKVYKMRNLLRSMEGKGEQYEG